MKKRATILTIRTGRSQPLREPTAAPESSIEVEHLCEGVGVELHQQRPEGYQVERHGGDEPKDVAVDECAEEQIDLTVEHDEQLTADEFRQDSPETSICYQNDDGVGQKHGQPQEVVATEMGGDQEALDGRITGDRLEDIRFHHHAWRGLKDKAEQIVEHQNHRHH